jgi:AraC-like DNA-binding protein/mannose-6-phosphate isomerase-like protein (cupin superfamily)
MRITREAVRHPDESLRCMRLELAAFRGSLHRHAHVELTWIERGQGLRWVGDSVEPFFDGDLVLVGGETAHMWASRGPQPAGGCATTVVQFPPDWAWRTGLPELAGVPALLRHAAGGVEVLGATRSEVQQLLRGLQAASPPRRIAAFVGVLGALMEGAADLRPLSTPRAARAPAPEGPAERGAARRIDRVLNWIESHLADELRADEAAALAHVSPAAFARFFRREVGKSFTEYVNDARCGWAALRLIQGREPVAEIAHGCGFPTLSNFGEQFRRRHGVTPTAFRRGGERGR